MADAIPFNLTMKEAAKKFADKVALTRDEFDALADWAKVRSFTVATVTKAEILNDIKDAVQKAINEGTTLADFNASLSDVMDARGWTGLTPWHRETVFRTSVQTSYGSGRLDQQREQADDFPWWLYVAQDADDECDDLDGTVFSIDEVERYPPIHVNCKCHGEPLTQAEAEELGIDENPGLPDAIDFAGPGSDSDYEPDFDGIDEGIAADAQGALDGFDPADVED